MERFALAAEHADGKDLKELSARIARSAADAAMRSQGSRLPAWEPHGA